MPRYDTMGNPIAGGQDDDAYLSSLQGQEGATPTAQGRADYEATNKGGWHKTKYQGADAWIGPDGQISLQYDPHAVDPTLQNTASAMQKQADEFKQNMPRLGNELFGQQAQSQQRQLAQGLAGIRENSSKRGLLYSGLRQSDELGARAQAGSRLASARADINNELTKQQAAMNDMAVQSGLAVQQVQRGLADATFSQALTNMQTGLNNANAIGKFGGQIAGTYFANRGNSNNSTPYNYSGTYGDTGGGSGGGLMSDSGSMMTSYGGE